MNAEEWPTIAAAVGLPPLRSRRPSGGGSQSLAAYQLGPVRMAEMVTPPSECFRSAAFARASDEELWQIDVIAHGTAMVEQGRSQASLGPTDLAVIDPARPVRYSSTATRHVTMMLPRRLVRLRQDDVARLSAVRIGGDRGPGVLVSSLARNITRTVNGMRADEAARLGIAIAELISAVLRAQLGRTQPNPDDLLRARVLTFIETRLPDPGLSPLSIARAHHISVRRLHKLFEDQPMTVAASIRQRRLHMCRNDLTDPALNRLTVAAIAARWGFADPAHFSKLFKAAYGTTATEYRLG